MGAPGPAAFDTLSGPLTVARHGEGYEMDFPALAPRRIEPPQGLTAALGFEPAEVWAAQFIVVIARDEAQVRAADPDSRALKIISRRGHTGPGNVEVTALADSTSPEVVNRFTFARLGHRRGSTTRLPQGCVSCRRCSP